MKDRSKSNSLPTGAPFATTTVNVPVSHEDIAVRAYELYAASGYAPDRDLEFWLEAESQLNQQGESP